MSVTRPCKLMVFDHGWHQTIQDNTVRVHGCHQTRFIKPGKLTGFWGYGCHQTIRCTGFGPWTSPNHILRWGLGPWTSPTNVNLCGLGPCMSPNHISLQGFVPSFAQGRRRRVRSQGDARLDWPHPLRWYPAGLLWPPRHGIVLLGHPPPGGPGGGSATCACRLSSA